MLTTFSISIILQKVYLVKICPIFDDSASNRLTRYQKSFEDVPLDTKIYWISLASLWNSTTVIMLQYMFIFMSMCEVHLIHWHYHTNFIFIEIESSVKVFNSVFLLILENVRPNFQTGIWVMNNHGDPSSRFPEEMICNLPDLLLL